MAHELELVNGTHSYVGREPGWHSLGTVIEDLSYDDAMAAAHLSGWDIATAPLTAFLGNEETGKGIMVPSNGKYLVYRKHPETGDPDFLGVAGEDYTPHQNEDAFGVAPFLEDMGWTVETAGSIRDGRQVFMSLRPQDGKRIVIEGTDGETDDIDAFILLSTSHDGSLATQASATAVRVVCANTLDYSLSGKVKRAYKVRHTSKSAERLAQAQQAFLTAQGYFTALADEAQRLARVEVTNAEFSRIVASLYSQPDEEKKAAHTRWENKVDLIGDLFSGGGEDFRNENIRGTAWGAQQALIEHIDWYRTGRGDDKETTLALARSGFDPNVTARKNKVRNTVLSFAKEKAPKVFA